MTNLVVGGLSIVPEGDDRGLEKTSSVRDEVVETWLSVRRRGVSDQVNADERSVEMADLSTKKREKLPAKDFGLPEKARTKEAKKESGNYPMPDKAHARNAKARAAQQQRAGNLTKQEKERIDRKADKKLDD
jgi:hypothetical protein